MQPERITAVLCKGTPLNAQNGCTDTALGLNRKREYRMAVCQQAIRNEVDMLRRLKQVLVTMIGNFY
jgi:hypothetical protein